MIIDNAIPRASLDARDMAALIEAYWRVEEANKQLRNLFQRLAGKYVPSKSEMYRDRRADYASDVARFFMREFHVDASELFEREEVPAWDK
jgi:hypothetical protein